jgi:hypothetical protein
MPTPSGILDNLTTIANQALALAVVWHVLAGGVIAVVFLGWRPSARLAALLMAAPAMTVSALAFASGNLFNGAAFAVLVLLLLTLASRAGAGRVQGGDGWATWIGGALVAYALVYPHFLGSHSAALYLVAAPVGLLPCPTLSLMIGFTLLAGEGLTDGWRTTLFAFGVFYALFGIVRLGVWLDAGLLIGAVTLVVVRLGSHDAHLDRVVRFRRA